MPEKKSIVKICAGRACSGRFSDFVAERAEQEKNLKKIDVEIERCACQGLCEKGPIVVTNGETKMYVDPVEMGKLMKKMSEKK
jgi:NADH:ubiquinone oxidoreductase subunit E